MKFSTVASIGAAATAAQALKLTATGGQLHGNGIYCIHEGAAINYCFANPESSAQEFGYDEASGAITQKLNDEITLSMEVQTGGQYPVVMMGPGDSTEKWSIQDGQLAVNGSTGGFYGCMNINDPYGYSKDAYAIVYFGKETNTTAQCTELTISADKGGSGNTTTTSSGPVPTSTGYPNSTFTCTEDDCHGPATSTQVCTETKCEPTTVPVTCTKEECEQPTGSPSGTQSAPSQATGTSEPVPTQVNGASSLQIGSVALGVVGAALLAL
ncbi:hypothetical protein TRICI_002910 [Trichomonascus ciferrii]|uniref:Uncharacterized protein n=1 Tax=Trichomonascus ciferrii TaxID=44093 RepID=A0A642V5N8_9ASCO|nr:hypothetical protein TRICI_002910 [Trichomonascus ciferrii]